MANIGSAMNLSQPSPQLLFHRDHGNRNGIVNVRQLRNQSLMSCVPCVG
jgi:hypothetical protein